MENENQMHKKLTRTLWHLLGLFVVSLAAVGRCTSDRVGRSYQGAIADLTTENQALKHKVESLVEDRSAWMVKHREQGLMTEAVEAELKRQRDRHTAVCETPLPEKLWPLYDKCEQAWSECDWSGSTVTTNDRTYNWCEARAQECRFLLSAAQPGVR